MNDREKKRRARIKADVIERDGSICCYCDHVLTSETISMEHITPDSQFGQYNATNLTVACVKCNNRRGNKPFFQYCKFLKWPQEKLNKYQRLVSANLLIKMLNIAKEYPFDHSIPNQLINQACQQLDLEPLSFAEYERYYCFTVPFDQECSQRDVQFNFVQLIRIIEMEAK